VIEFFDSHCHLTDAAFREDREAVFRRAFDVGVRGLVSIASDLADSRAAIKLVEGWSGAWCTVGIHPHEAEAAGPEDMARVAELARDERRVVALGETGLDYHYDHSPREAQRTLLDAHLALGAALDLPVVVHARDADADLIDALRRMPEGTRGVLHCFVGGPDLLEEALARGWYASFSGITSFRSFRGADLLRRVPPERLLIETDSPYLTPVPLRGTRNEPAFVRYVAEAVAGHLSESLEEVAARTSANAVRFYGLKES